jgi:hypothetical protein
MARILAIEPDPERSARLQQLVSEHFTAEVVLTTSTGDALVTLADVAPDVILTSSLLSPGDDDRLTAHLRAAPDLDHLPVLTIPPLPEHKESPVKPQSLWSRLLRRRQRQQTWPTYDFSAIAARIEEALEQSRIEAPESEIERPARMFLLETRRTLLLEAGSPEAIAHGATTQLVRFGEEFGERSALRDWRSRARRWNSHELPWLSSVQLMWGTRLRLINISSTGLLVESDRDLTLEDKTCFQLEGPDQEELIVPASIIRAEPSNEDPSAVKYVVAAVFERPFESLGPVRSLRELRRFQRLA